MLPPAIIGLLAAVLLLWGLDDKYLWQDEANTAVLATRLLRFGRPLAYDGVNLITIDNFAAEQRASIGLRTGGARAAVDYYIARGDLKPDSTWKWHPWGQFIVAGAGIELLGQTTLGARLPFALAGILTVLLLYRFVDVYCGSRRMASIAALLLALNTYWILHSRQCRYYSLSSCLLVLTLLAYFHWQTGRKWGAAVFVVASWCWFQVDYGTVWPVWGVLFADAFLAQRRTPLRPLAVGAALAASIAPFVWYYELWGRAGVISETLTERVRHSLLHTNDYLAPVVVIIAATAIAVVRRRNLPPIERRALFVAAGIVVALAVWVPTVAAMAFVRYLIVAAPAGALVCAWFVVRVSPWQPALVAAAGTALLIFTPWLGLPLSALRTSADHAGSALFRSELLRLGREVFGHRPDPNRILIEWLAAHAAPGDEILINYEDAPLMYYLPNPIRGGIAAFRVEDDSTAPPRFAALRRSVKFVHWPVFVRELGRCKWRQIPLPAPDVEWGNNPDPSAQYPDEPAGLLLLEREPEPAR